MSMLTSIARSLGYQPIAAILSSFLGLAKVLRNTPSPTNTGQHNLIMAATRLPPMTVALVVLHR